MRQRPMSGLCYSPGFWCRDKNGGVLSLDSIELLFDDATVDEVSDSDAGRITDIRRGYEDTHP